MTTTDFAFGFGLVVGSVGWLIRDLVGLFGDHKRTEAYAAELERAHPSTPPLEDPMPPGLVDHTLAAIASVTELPVGRTVGRQREPGDAS